MSIKSWWKSLFQEPDLSTSDLPKVTYNVPMPEVKPKPEKDISEPVLSFIKLYKQNHRKFKISAEPFVTPDVDSWTLYDKENNKTFTASVGWGYCNSYYRGGKNTEWITEEELIFVFDEIRSFLNSRKVRVENKRNARARERLTKLYKGE